MANDAMTRDQMICFSSCSSTIAPGGRCRWRKPRQCNQQRASPIRRSRKQSKHSNRHIAQSWTASLLCCLLLLCRSTTASPNLPTELLFDRRAPPPPPPPLPPRMHLEARDEASATVRPAGSATATGSLEVATETFTALPRPFDSNIGNNFTTSTCPTFFDRFLSNQTFIDCLPLSLLLQTSNAFFTASRSRVCLTTALDSTCNVNFPQCSALMTSLAQEIQQNSNCASDLSLGNPTVVQAYHGFLAYDTVYHAGCLADAEAGGYCYANAATNASAPTSSYIYYLPLGVRLPGGSRPACTTCLQNTMAIFAQKAGNPVQPLSAGYESAAEQVRMSCGPTFVQASVEMSSLAVPAARPGDLGLVPMLSLLLFFFFGLLA